MEKQRWEYKVVYVENWNRVSVEGVETYPEMRERRSGFGRRFLNSMGAEGWEMVGIQHTRPGAVYYLFKRPLAPDAQPDLTVVRHTRNTGPKTEEREPGAGAEAVSL